MNRKHDKITRFTLCMNSFSRHHRDLPAGHPRVFPATKLCHMAVVTLLLFYGRNSLLLVPLTFGRLNNHVCWTNVLYIFLKTGQMLLFGVKTVCCSVTDTLCLFVLCDSVTSDVSDVIKQNMYVFS